MRLRQHGTGQVFHNENVIKNESALWGPRTIAVTSGKGGVGKTSVAVNLAVCLAKMGNQVTIFDADLGLANAEVLLGIVPQYSLFDVLYGGMTLDQITVWGPYGIKVVSGGSGFLEMANLDRSRRRQLLGMFNRFFNSGEIVLIDTSAGISKNVLGFVAAAGEVIIVVTPEPTSLTDAYALIKILANFKLHTEVNVLINRAADKKEAMRAIGRISMTSCRYLEIKINFLGWVPEDKQVLQAVKSQEPYCMANQHGPAARSITRIAEALVGCRRAPEEGFWARLMGLFS